MLNSVLLWNSIMPRAMLALIAGAALGLSGTLLQRVLRNPIADASTLGIASGAELAMTAAMGFSPLLIGFSREMAAFGGGLAAVAIVLALSWRRGLDPVTVALSGLIVSLIASALSVTLILSRGEYAMSIYIWGAGSLSQQDWNGALSLGPRLILGFAAALLLVRPLRILALDDSGARSLGLALHSTRLAIVALAVWLAASVISEVGVIGFVGLAAPAHRKACRRAQHRQTDADSAADGRRPAVPDRLPHPDPRPRLHRSCADGSRNRPARRSLIALPAAARAFRFGRCRPVDRSAEQAR